MQEMHHTTMRLNNSWSVEQTNGLWLPPTAIINRGLNCRPDTTESEEQKNKKIYSANLVWGPLAGGQFVDYFYSLWTLWTNENGPDVVVVARARDFVIIIAMNIVFFFCAIVWFFKFPLRQFDDVSILLPRTQRTEINMFLTAVQKNITRLRVWIIHGRYDKTKKKKNKLLRAVAIENNFICCVCSCAIAHLSSVT